MKSESVILLLAASLVSACFQSSPPPYIQTPAPARPASPQPATPPDSEPPPEVDCTWVDAYASWEEVWESVEGTYVAEAGVTTASAGGRPGAGQGGRYGTVELRLRPGGTLSERSSPDDPGYAFEIRGWPRGDAPGSPWFALRDSRYIGNDPSNFAEAEGFPPVESLLRGTGCELRDLLALNSGPKTIVTDEGTTIHQLWLLKTGPARFDGLWQWSGEGGDVLGRLRVTLTRTN